MKTLFQNHSTALISLALVSLCSILILLLFNGIGEEADSFHHYLIARYAPGHPKLYFDHWGKPIYTLLSSPFAQFGLIGSKIFNLICSLTSAFIAYLISKELKLKQPALVILLIFLIPLNFQVNFSAFTEPLFALALMGVIWLSLKNKLNLAMIIVSFMPLIRSEGLLIIGVFGLWLLIRKDFKRIPLLAVGQVAYGLMAWIFFGKSPLWTFSEIPYANMDSPYGSGGLFHFAEKLIYICGFPLLLLFLCGLLWSLFKYRNQRNEWNVLIIGSFFAFFIFHSLAWYFGWFSSMGLKRVFGAITPLMGIIMLYGLNSITALFKNEKLKRWFSWIYPLIAAVFLFSGGPAAVNWSHEMNLTPSQKLADEVGTYIKEEGIEYRRLIYADRFLQHSLQNDPYDYREYWPLEREILSKIRKDDLLIWDNWHATTDFGIRREMLDNNPQLEALKDFEIESRGKKVQFVIYKRKK